VRLRCTSFLKIYFFFTALQEQLGLKLESATASVEVLVIDSVSKPSANQICGTCREIAFFLLHYI